MIEDLTVRDFALIDSVYVEFLPGFNVLSGETGAGKSILIGSLTFLFGGKAGTDVIRSGSEEARVSGSIYLNPRMKTARDWLSDKGILPEDERIMLRRVLKKNGKSGMWIQDVPVTRAELVEFTSLLVDIHGQHDHQSLLKVDEHRRFLDSFAGIEDEVRSFTESYSQLALLRKSRDEMNSSERERSAKKEILSFAIEEISSAKLLPAEENDLETEEQKLSQYEKLSTYIIQLCDTMGTHQDGIVPSIKKTRLLLESAASIDTGLTALGSRLESSYYEIDDISASLREYRDSLSFDPGRLEQVQERLSKIYKLKKKYGESIPSILEYLEDAKQQLIQLDSWENNRAELEDQIVRREKDIYAKGRELSQKRHEAALRLQAGVESVLSKLGMAGTVFKVHIDLPETRTDVLNSYPWGFDAVEFMISANPGEPVKPLSRIASGGEMSRVMLALKTVLADADDSDTLIFDEIDAGIGGEVALAVGSHLRMLSGKKQVLCITHLASIAARADNQIRIEKKSDGVKTVTSAEVVDGDMRVEEIARMLAGDGFSNASLVHARELLQTLSR